MAISDIRTHPDVLKAERLLYDLDAFEEYLASKDPNEVVGDCGKPRGCVLHWYLCNKGIDASVYGLTIVVHLFGGEKVELPIPFPLQTTINLLDLDPKLTKVTAPQVLEVLREVRTTLKN